MKQPYVLARVCRYTALGSLLFVGSSFSATVQASYVYTPWTEPWDLTFSVPPDDYGVAGDLVWYCGDETEPSCACDAPMPTMVHFRKTFSLPDPGDWYQWGYFNIVADDYYALYINGVLKGENWLDVSNAATYYDFSSEFNVGQSNQIDVFACDGYPTAGSHAGTTLGGGFNACSNALPRVNSFVAMSGEFHLQSRSDDDYKFASVDFRSSGSGALDPFGWQVRAARSVPVPGSLFLMLLGLGAFAACRQYRSTGKFA